MNLSSRSRDFWRLLGMGAILVLALPDASQAQSEEQRAEEQQRLDQACEAARERMLAPERQRLVEQCVSSGERDSREACERYYADYGNRAGNRPGLYYDLPECRKAFEHQRSYRSDG